MDQETSEEFKIVRDQFNAEFKTVNSRLSALETDVAVIRSNYVTRADMAEQFGGLRTEMAKMESRLIRWMVGMSVTVAGIVFGLARYIG
ncbi:hypothetical protein ACLB1G_09205 [Oxalobacteraceae bacterium A2-2]